MEKKKFLDLSCKKEKKIQVLIESKYIVKLKRKGFDYTKDYLISCFITGKNIDDYKIPYEYHCDCEDKKCNSLKCKCIKSYAQKYECNKNCKCDENGCNNRIVSEGNSLVLRLELTPNKGFGVFSNELIKKGNFICNYVGEIVNKDAAEKKIEENYLNKKENYIIKACEDYGNIKTVICIDASVKGNISRFFNHSCDPNIYMDIIRTDNFIPNISFFALRDIQINEELTFCYNNEPYETKYNRSYKKCLCGVQNCKLYLPSS